MYVKIYEPGSDKRGFRAFNYILFGQSHAINIIILNFGPKFPFCQILAHI